ncbi:hypothetical protein Rhe02_71770 [Rhizocola hellebori]|uniref:Uncharacterized protein n=1 Tax=Rhizocola hellebori TaxID=1392758 RepID=A0A8J3QG67_9ACTN|nr:hypothetical protein [Rhizocola hellebori]GIH09110.1 hypothetical protein Rhe02_71770 [Rhizocola hellebori]
MPTSVLLAVLAAAGLLALAPALVRRYDATERLIAERALSTARVLSRRRRARTTPGRQPVNPPSWLLAEPPRLQLVDEDFRPPASRRPRHRPSVYRRRRVLSALALLNLVQLIGVVLVSPGFWISFTVTAAMLLLYLGHLRGQALRMARRRRAEARQAAWLAEQQAQVRLAQERRAQARREAARLLEEELLRAQEAMRELAEQAAAAAVAERGKRVATISYRKVAGVRGRAYEVGPAA